MEYWIAFIVLCSSPECTDARTYTDNAQYSYASCQEHGRGWAVQMKALTNKEYSFGCTKMDYTPREIK
jgi:hypothetical protein